MQIEILQKPKRTESPISPKKLKYKIRIQERNNFA